MLRPFFWSICNPISTVRIGPLKNACTNRKSMLKHRLLSLCAENAFSNTAEKRKRFCTQAKTDKSRWKRIKCISTFCLFRPVLWWFKKKCARTSGSSHSASEQHCRYKPFLQLFYSGQKKFHRKVSETTLFFHFKNVPNTTITLWTQPAKPQNKAQLAWPAKFAAP